MNVFQEGGIVGSFGFDVAPFGARRGDVIEDEVERRSGNTDALRNGQEEKFEKSSNAILCWRDHFEIEIE